MADDVAGVHRRSVRRGGMRNDTTSDASGREDLSGIRTPLFPAQVFERVNVNPTPDPTTAGAVSGRPKIEPGDPLRRKSLSCSGAKRTEFATTDRLAQLRRHSALMSALDRSILRAT
jgi:hypothetical protein